MERHYEPIYFDVINLSDDFLERLKAYRKKKPERLTDFFDYLICLLTDDEVHVEAYHHIEQWTSFVFKYDFKDSKEVYKIFKNIKKFLEDNYSFREITERCQTLEVWNISYDVYFSIDGNTLKFDIDSLVDLDALKERFPDFLKSCTKTSNKFLKAL